MYLQKTVSIFHKDYPEKQIAILALSDSIPPMAKPTI